MENKQGSRKPAKKTKAAGADLRQLDMWTGGGPPPAVPAPTIDTKKVPEPVVAKGKIAPAPKPVATPAPVKVTVSSVAKKGPSPARSAPVPAASRDANRSPPALTRKQHELLDYLRRREDHGERAPSLTEICRDLGLASRGSLHKQVTALVEARLVEPMNGKQRGVRLLAAAANDDVRLPMLGAIAAGRPIEAVVRDESVVVPGWLRTGAECYALRVRGDSMQDAGILDGDIVIVESRETARNGEMVVALIDGQDTTLKRIEQRGGEVLLHAENPLYAPQRYAPDRVRIQGVVVSQLRRY